MRKSLICIAATAALSASSLASPSAQESAVAQAKPKAVVNPVWRSRPGNAEFTKAFEKAVTERPLNGFARLACLVAANGTLKDCRVAAEQPHGRGYGQAALALAPRFRMAPKDADRARDADRPIGLPLLMQRD